MNITFGDTWVKAFETCSHCLHEGAGCYLCALTADNTEDMRICKVEDFGDCDDFDGKMIRI